MKDKKRNNEIYAREKEWYKEKIVGMTKEIENESHIKMIYGFVKTLYESNR